MGNVLSRISHCLQFYQQQKKLRRHIKSYPTEQTQRIRQNLYWYGIQMNKLLGLGTLFRIIKFNLLSTATDENAANHGIISLYYHSQPDVSDSQPSPSVWYFQDISHSPWPTPVNSVESLLRENFTVIQQERLDLEARLSEMNEEQLGALGIQQQSKGETRDKYGKRVPLFTLNGSWQGLYFHSVKGENHFLRDLCPGTFKLIDQININRNFGLVFYSDLAPGTEIMPHSGGSNLRLRCHFGITVPEPQKTKITVGGQTKTWHQGECIFFDDAYRHSVTHSGTQTRTILNIDLWNTQLTEQEIEILDQPIFSEFGKARPIAA